MPNLTIVASNPKEVNVMSAAERRVEMLIKKLHVMVNCSDLSSYRAHAIALALELYFYIFMDAR